MTKIDVWESLVKCFEIFVGLRGRIDVFDRVSLYWIKLNANWLLQSKNMIKVINFPDDFFIQNFATDLIHKDAFRCLCSSHSNRTSFI